MSEDHAGALPSDAEKPKSTRRRMGIRSLLILVACFGAVLWSLRHLSENYDAELVDARAIQKESMVALRSGTKSERLRAMYALARLSKGEPSVAIRALSESLEDPDTEIRVSAADSLNWVTPIASRSSSGGDAIPIAVASLIRCLKDSDARLRAASAKALGTIAQGFLRAGSKDQPFQDATIALATILKDPETEVRAAGAANLGAIAASGGGRTAFTANELRTLTKTLAEAFDDPENRVRHAAIVALTSRPGRFDEPPALLLKGLKDESTENRLATVRGLHMYVKGLDPWAPLLFRLMEEDGDPKMQRECANTLNYAFNPPAITRELIPFLVAKLESKSVQVRIQAASFLGHFGKDSDQAVPILLRMLGEPLDPTRKPENRQDPGSAAAQSLGRIAPGSGEAREVIAALMEVAQSGPTIRHASAMYALANFGSDAEAAVPFLIQVVKEPAPKGAREWEASAYALGFIAPETPLASQAVEALIPLLNSNDYWAQIHTIEALGKFGPKAAPAVPKLLEIKNHQAPRSKEAAVKALAAIQIK